MNPILAVTNWKKKTRNKVMLQFYRKHKSGKKKTTGIS
jgi:hypothetical protein